MSNEQLNQLVEATVNPYMLFKMEFNHTKEELEELGKQFSLEFVGKFESNVIEIEVTPTLFYLFIKQNFLNELKENIKHIKYSLTDASDEIWNMDSLNIFDDGDPAPEATKLMFPNNLTNFDILQCAFASIGEGLTDAEASSFYTAVQTYQTTLGRQV